MTVSSDEVNGWVLSATGGRAQLLLQRADSSRPN